MTPTDVTSATVKLWIRGTDSVSGLSDGDRCPTLDDLSGNNHDLAQGTSAQQAIFRTNLANGLSGFQIGRWIDASTFEGHFYPIPDLALTGGTTGSHKFAVIRKRVMPVFSKAYGTLLGDNSGFAFSNTFPYTDGNIYDGFCSTTRHTVGAPSTALDAWFILEQISKDGQFTYKLHTGNATETVFTTASNTFYDPGSSAKLGADSRDADANYDGWLMELVQYDGIVTDATEYAELLAYFRNLYFVPTFTSAASGNWSTGSTWVGGVAPSVENSMVVISNGHTVTVDDTWTIGGSPSSNDNYPIVINNGGKLHIRNGGVLHCKGSINGNTTGELQLGDSTGPGELYFDSAAAASATNYRMFGGTLTATSDAVTNRNSVSSNTGAGGSNASFVDTLLDAAERIRFEDMGTASIPVFEFITTGRVQAANDLVFERCGTAFKWSVAGGMQAGDGFDFDSVTIRDSLATKSFVMTTPAVAPTVARILNQCIADKQLDLAPSGMTINGSLLLGHGFSPLAPNGVFTAFSNNLVRMLETNADMVPAGDWSNCVLVADGSALNATAGTYDSTADIENMHWMMATPVGGASEFSFDNGIVESFGDDGAGDVFRAYPTGPGILHISRTIGFSQNSADAGTLVTFMGAGQLSAEHCTWMTSQRGALMVGETGDNVAGQILSCRSNLCFTSPLHAGPAYIIGDWETNPSLPTDLADPANVSHNNWWDMTGAYAPTLDWSSAPGASDQNVDPDFVDSSRNFSTWVASIESSWAGNATPTRTDYNARGLHKLRVSNEPEHADYDSRYTLASYQAYIREGYTPQNSLLFTAGHDGLTVGAVEMAAAASGSFGVFESPIIMGAY